jgi:hypothetical protein
MENVVFATTPETHQHHTETAASAGSVSFKPRDATNPLHPCTVLAPRYVEDCYLMQTSMILHFNGGDFAAAAQACDRAPGDMRPLCYQSLGRDASGYALQNADEVVRYCSVGAAALRPWCIVGAVKNFIDVTADTRTGIALCRAVRGYAGKSKCYEAVGEQAWVLENTVAGRETRCADAEPAYRLACRYGARLQDE